MDAQLTNDYLKRIGVETDRGPNAEFLGELQERHLLTVPFENIDFHLGEPIRLGADAIDKVVRRNRGGTCRELNGSAFPTLLTSLGYSVSLLGSRVFIDNRPSFALAHTVIQVDCPRPWLVDVGFGRDGARYPLRMDIRGSQRDPNGRYEFIDAPGGDLDLLRDGETVLRIEMRPRYVEDFYPVLWWFESSPRSPFKENLFCTRVTEQGRITQRGDLLIKTEGALRQRTVLGNDAEIARAYKEYFDITLDRLPPIPGHISR